MKKLFISLLMFVTFSSIGQNLECEKFREGKFKIVDLMVGTSIIERKGSKQIEYGVNSRLKLEFKVKWINACTYTLKLKKILENPDDIEIPKKIRRMVLTVRIIETKENSYIQKTTSKLMDLEVQSEVIKTE